MKIPRLESNENGDETHSSAIVDNMFPSGADCAVLCHVTCGNL